jgi:hypothetical protein
MTLRRGFTGGCLALALLAAADAAHADTRVVRAGDNLQTALNAAQPGDILLLEAGATFRGNFTLPVKPGADYITVRSSAPDSQLPRPGVRITPAYVPYLPVIESPNAAPSLKAAPGAHHWRLQFLRFPSTLLGYNDIIRLGEGSSAQTMLSQVPYEIEMDRVYIHGHPLYGQKRGIALNGRSITIRNSYISDIKAVGIDTQAIGGWNGPGPFTIENNYLEATGENFLLGGSDPSIPGLVSENVVVRYNYMSRPMAWRDPVLATPSASAPAVQGGGALAIGTHTYRVIARRPVGAGVTGRSAASSPVSAVVGSGGSGVRLSWSAVPDATDYRVYVSRPSGASEYWTVASNSFIDNGATGASGAAPAGPGDTWQVKNVFELKNARHVLVEYNIFENNWHNAQPGYAILFTPRNQDGGCTWCVIEDVTFQYNIIRNSAGGINLSGYDWPNTSQQTAGVTIRHNLFYGITTGLGGAGWFLLIGDAPRDIIVDHNTIDFDGTTAVYTYGGSASAPRKIYGFQFTNNALRHNAYGINGASFSTGFSTLTAYYPGATVQGNWLQGGTASRYPAGNYFSGTFASGFADASAHDYRAASGGILPNRATDGSDIGADLGTLLHGVRSVVEGNMTPRPTAPSNLRLVR